MMKVLMINGSPRKTSNCQIALDQMIEIFEAEGVQVECIQVGKEDIRGCIGCDACRKAGKCAFDDDMTALMGVLDSADELYLVSPVYFAGPPSQLKAALDRLQPHYWKETRLRPKRPAYLHAVGEGGDPHGYRPLVTICKSALGVAGFALESVTPHIGRADA
jgi:multimeric flavodoxin WrbA